MLRPVGTMNWKDAANPRPVELLGLSDEYTFDEFAARLREAAEPHRASFARASAVSHANGSLPLGSLDVSTPKEFDPIYRGCRQIREAPFQSEEIWRGMLSVVRLCGHGDWWCHAMSKLDRARYRREDTEAKLVTLVRQQGAGGMPMTCATFNEKRPGICTACRHWGAIRSPVLLGLEGTPILAPAVAAAPVHVVGGEGATPGDFVVPRARAPETHREVPRLRDPRFRLVMSDEENEHLPMGVYFADRSKGDDGTWKEKLIPVSRQPALITDAAWLPDAQGGVVFTYFVRIYDVRRKVWDEAAVPGNLFVLSRQLPPELSGHGLTLCAGRESQERMLEYMKAYMNQVRQARAAVVLLEREGWAGDGTFVLKENQFIARTGDTPDGPNLEIVPGRLTPTAASIARMLEPKGELAKWKQAANLYAKPGQEAMAFLLFAGMGGAAAAFHRRGGFSRVRHGTVGQRQDLGDAHIGRLLARPEGTGQECTDLERRQHA
ncbi:uncharacterized protein DUF927 [Paraburkholderia eburnea]|uniref:Uncharacterized protein DUF927 n=1 Tax=Paraburkholderia eburnea TaxID=1189126 RepID=A0A2S4MG36_9BURK|nr:uncharacterized protein DUF927 [Paraburkholderia eburnea]PRZ25563.1 uncharacterized protein DUF927 [Paraburkholderia eburnea]